MHHFLFEFITGGGLSGQSLPASLSQEGELMLNALLRDLLQAGYSNISLTRDARLTPLTAPIIQHSIEGEIKEKLPELINRDDIVWLIAPETGECLASFTELLIKQGCTLIGSKPESIRLTTSKLKTNRQLQKVNVETIETCLVNAPLPVSEHGWIVKPDDGVGAEGCYFFIDKEKLTTFISSLKQNNYIVQPYIQGKHMSMSLLMYDGDARLIGCNQQYINIDTKRVQLTAIGVNECLDCYEHLLPVAKKIAHIIPGLSGYIGVDLIKTEDNFVVVEINPRLTTAYAGLSESLGINVVDKILDIFIRKRLPDFDVSAAKPVRIDV